jgi:hypothetical protein
MVALPQFAVVFDQAELTELVHEVVDARARFSLELNS